MNARGFEPKLKRHPPLPKLAAPVHRLPMDTVFRLIGATMPSFGQKLKQERESRATSIEEIAGTTGIHIDYLAALEHDRFDALPGRAFGKFYIRAYAEVLGFDPQPLIAEYDRETKSRTPKEPPEIPKKRRIHFRPSAPPPIVEEETVSTVQAPRGPAIEEPFHDAMEPLETEATSEASERETVEPPDQAERDAATQPIELTPNAHRIATEPTAADLPDAIPPIEPDREGSQLPQPPAENEDTLDAGPDSEATAPARVPRWNVATAAAASMVLVLAMIGIYGAMSGNDGAVGSSVPAELDATRATVGRAPPEASPTVTPPPTASSLPDAEPQDRPSAAAPADLTVSEFGVGRRVVDRQLQGRGERFEEGEVVWFSTRVLGGGPGHHVRHVWTLDGKTMQSLDLELGGPHWRTHSRKTLWGPGNWVAEAQDPNGRVLARATFTVVPPGS